MSQAAQKAPDSRKNKKIAMAVPGKKFPVFC